MLDKIKKALDAMGIRYTEVDNTEIHIGIADPVSPAIGWCVNLITLDNFLRADIAFRNRDTKRYLMTNKDTLGAVCSFLMMVNNRGFGGYWLLAAGGEEDTEPENSVVCFRADMKVDAGEDVGGVFLVLMHMVRVNTLGVMEPLEALCNGNVTDASAAYREFTVDNAKLVSSLRKDLIKTFAKEVNDGGVGAEEAERRLNTLLDIHNKKDSK